MAYLAGSFVHGIHAVSGHAPDAVHHLVHFLGGGYRFFRQLAHFVGHHGKTASRFTCAGRFYGRIKRQQIGLVCNVVDDIKHHTYGFGLRAQFVHGCFQGAYVFLDIGYKLQCLVHLARSGLRLFLRPGSL
jgi:hypothetical protein